MSKIALSSIFAVFNDFSLKDVPWLYSYVWLQIRFYIICKLVFINCFDKVLERIKWWITIFLLLIHISFLLGRKSVVQGWELGSAVKCLSFKNICVNWTWDMYASHTGYVLILFSFSWFKDFRGWNWRLRGHEKFTKFPENPW